MRKILLSIVACSTLLTVGAQEVEVVKREQLLKGVESIAYYPVLSEDGEKVVFSTSNYEGLKLYDFKNDVVIKISDAERAGLYPKISEDGVVYYVTQKRVGALNYRNLESYDLSSGVNSVIVEGERSVKAPQLIKGGVAVKSSKGMSQTASSVEPTIYVDGSTIVIAANGKERILSPIESEAGYVWASLSPDATKILFVAAGKGMFIIDLTGNILAEFAEYQAPVWYGNDYVVAQNATDDGHQFSSSQIVMLKGDGSYIKELTTPTSMAMYPTASADANKVIYSTIDGKLYMMEISVVE
ncbi:MAG: hypothetical protein R3Y22_09710 [Bacteroidales bacterium]